MTKYLCPTCYGMSRRHGFLCEECNGEGVVENVCSAKSFAFGLLAIPLLLWVVVAVAGYFLWRWM